MSTLVIISPYYVFNLGARVLLYMYIGFAKKTMLHYAHANVGPSNVCGGTLLFTSSSKMIQ